MLRRQTCLAGVIVMIASSQSSWKFEPQVDYNVKGVSRWLLFDKGVKPVC